MSLASALPLFPLFPLLPLFPLFPLSPLLALALAFSLELGLSAIFVGEDVHKYTEKAPKFEEINNC